MVVNYSKWDALELSDDSDIEVHPNVDKRSFIRAKQNQIHHDRLQRKHQIETFKYERIINDGLLTRIDNLLKSLKAHAASSTENADEIVFQSLIESAGDPAADQPPPRPDGVHAKMEAQPTYSRMMAALIDQVKKHVDATRTEDRLDGYVAEVGVHKAKVLDLQQNLLKELAKLEKLESSKITSENIHTGFDSSHVTKRDETTSVTGGLVPTKTSSTKTELLNSPQTPRSNEPADSGSEADVEDDQGDEGHIQPSVHGKAFGKIDPTNYRESLQFISQHPSILAERETDGLLIQAFDSQNAGKGDLARQYVHQALLLQYCRSLGKDGVALFFRRITTKDHQARKLFYDDVNSTYARLRDRSAEMAKERAENPDEEVGGVEQIQLHAVNPGQTININVPPANDPEGTDARKAFESFPPGLQRALDSGSLDEVNKVLAKMSVEEAEEVVGQLGEFGMLSMEEGVIDATTEEGKAQMKQIEETGRMPGKENDNDLNVEPGAAEVDEMD